MNPEHLMNEPCIIARRTESTGRDEYNNPVKVTTYTAGLCWFHQGSGDGRGQQSEKVAEGNVVHSTWTYYFPAGTTLTELDEVTTGPDDVMAPLVAKVKAGTLVDEDLADVDGLAAREVNGEPHPWTHPRTGDIKFVQATLVKAG